MKGAHRFMEEFDCRQNIASIVIKNLLLNYLCWFHNVGDILYILGPGVALWLRRCATSRTVPGSIPGGVTGFFSDIFPSNQTMALGSTQPLVKMSTRNIPVGKGGRCVRLTTYHHTVLLRNLGALTS